jgi:hypothetical protein
MKGTERGRGRDLTHHFPGRSCKNMLHLAKALAGFGIYPKSQYWNCEEYCILNSY